MKIIGRRGIERGSWRSFFMWWWTFVAVCAVVQLAHITFDDFALQIWGSREPWYLERFRPFSAKIWRMLHRVNSEPICAVLPPLWVFATLCIHRGLPRSAARKALVVHAIALLLFGLTCLGCQFNVLHLPLI